MFRPLKKPGVVIQHLGFITEIGVIMNLKCLEKDLGKVSSDVFSEHPVKPEVSSNLFFLSL